MRFPRSRGGQIVIPALLIFPTLFLFVYLIYETAKLSREKIKHQFAMDAAAFVEMTNYSDFLNRTAYVNGAFPMRIFEEGYWDFDAPFATKCEGSSCKETYATMLYKNGVFPHLGGEYKDGHKPEGNPDFQGLGKWTIEYGGNGKGKNSNPPDLAESVPGDDVQNSFLLTTQDNSTKYWVPTVVIVDMFKLYVQIFSLLGSVEDAQFQVLERLTTGGGVPHSFMQKSYWLNTGDPVGDANVLATSFDLAMGVSDFKQVVHPACLKKMDYWSNEFLHGGFQQFVPQHTQGIDLTQVAAGNGCQSVGGGLFEIEYLDNSMYTTLHNGLPIQMPWAVPSQNFFNVDFGTLMTQKYGGRELHTTISLLGDPSNTPAVWPDPTPKFQVRQFP
ncbi:MAG: TadE/TadG family type IV pilus assembly protein [Elusimicrobiota bacterium]